MINSNPAGYSLSIEKYLRIHAQCRPKRSMSHLVTKNYMTKKVFYITSLIWPRVIDLQVSGHNIDIAAVLSTELAAYPSSMFVQNGLMKNTLMSVLKKTLQVVMSERIADISDTIVFDVSALMWTIQWPSDTLPTYIEAFKEFCGTRIRCRRCCICVRQIFCRKHKGIHVLAHIETNERGVVPRSCAFWGYASRPTPEKCYTTFLYISNTTTQFHYRWCGGRACWDEQRYTGASAGIWPVVRTYDAKERGGGWL